MPCATSWQLISSRPPATSAARRPSCSMSNRGRHAHRRCGSPDNGGDADHVIAPLRRRRDQGPAEARGKYIAGSQGSLRWRCRLRSLKPELSSCRYPRGSGAELPDQDQRSICGPFRRLQPGWSASTRKPHRRRHGSEGRRPRHRDHLPGRVARRIAQAPDGRDHPAGSSASAEFGRGAHQCRLARQGNAFSTRHRRLSITSTPMA